MEAIKIEVTGNIAKVIEKPLRITSGTVGLPVEFVFDSHWDNMTKVAVFNTGIVKKNMKIVGNSTVVPIEALAVPELNLSIGVYGVSEDGSVATPTVWASVSQIRHGAVPGSSFGSDIGTAKKYYDLGEQAAENADASAKKAESEADRSEGAMNSANEIVGYFDEQVQITIRNIQSFTNNAYEAARDAAESEKKAEDAAERAETAAATGQNRHAKFFTITEDAVLSLKPEYRGSCYGAIEFVRGMDVTNGYFYVDKLGSGSTLYECVHTSNDTALEEHGGYPQSLDDAYYFKRVDDYENKVSDNGAGMAGSKTYELPSLLYVPETVNGIVVTAFAPMALDHNHAIKEIVLPSTVTSIPEQCFFGCQNLESVYNTDHITNIGKLSFSRCIALKRIYLPSLETAEEQAFRSCTFLEYAHIGKVSALADNIFRGCYELSKIEHDNAFKVTTVGKGAFEATYELREADFVKDVTYMDIGAFFKSGINYDWGSLTECKFAEKQTVIKDGETYTFQAYPTSLQLNPVDFWSDCKPSACHNYTPTHFCQLDPRWINRWVGNAEESQIAYGNGCALFTFIHAYCGLNRLELHNVAEFEGIVNRLVDNDPSIWVDYQNVRNGTAIKEWGERLGLSVTEYYEYNTSTLQMLYEALFDGNYVYAVVPTYTTSRGQLEVNRGGHAALISGVTEDGRLTVVDSAELYPEDMTYGKKYDALYQSSFHPGVDGSTKPVFCIISKPVDYLRYATIEDALAGTNVVADGAVGVYTDKYGKYHVVLLGDIQSATMINIQRNCTLHLNGYTLTFTAPGAYLNIDTAKEVVIDGTAVRKEQSGETTVFRKGAIKKDGITGNGSSHELLVKTTGTNLTIYGGEYSITNITNPGKNAVAIAAGASTPVASVVLNDCSIVANSLEAATAYGVNVDSVTMNNCSVDATSTVGKAICAYVYADAVIKRNSRLTACASDESEARGVNLGKNFTKADVSDSNITATVNGYASNNPVYGIYASGTGTLTLTDCDITANRLGVDESDYVDTPRTEAVWDSSTVTVNLIGSNSFTPAYP